MSVLEISILYVVDKVFEYVLSETILKRLVFKLLYKDRLVQIINETINKHEESYPYSNRSDKPPFYHSQYIFEKLLKTTLFKDNNLAELPIICKQNPSFSLPSEKELCNFIEIFISKIKSDKSLKVLFIDENYKEEIFNISQLIISLSPKINEINNTTSRTLKILEKDLLSVSDVIQALDEQVNKQLEKQKRSEKYIPKTFIEIDEEKDLLRYVCLPNLFLKKQYEEIARLDFRRLNVKLNKAKLPSYDFDFTRFGQQLDTLNCSNSKDFILKMLEYLNAKDDELRSLDHSENDKYKFKTKITDQIKKLRFFLNNVILIKESAGQGKTNFVCDFAENVLTKKKIPFSFLTGYEIIGDIDKSIVSRTFPFTNKYNFVDVLEKMSQYCVENDKNYIVIIDGINENPNPRQLAFNLERFIEDVSRYGFVKVILTCRTEYYDINFSNIQSLVDNKKIGVIDSLNQRLSDIGKEKLFVTYLNYFNIKINHIDDKAKKQLVDNFILLRIFCDAYKDKDNLIFDNIYKDELFEKYYENKSKEINERINGDEEHRYKGSFDTKIFLKRITEYMVANNQYSSIPLENILSAAEDWGMYLRFLDENILIKRDVGAKTDGIFEAKDVVNFTFDEFRDFIISQYLVSVLYPQAKDKFKIFVETNLSERSQIAEGCRSFLFLFTRKTSDEEIKSILIDQKWYEDAFIQGLFSIRDLEITEEDLEILKRLFQKSTAISKHIIITLAYRRYDTEKYKKLNIQTLFEILDETDEKQHKELLYPLYDINSRIGKTDIEKILDRMEEIIENKELEEFPAYHNVFNYILYLFPLDEYGIAYLYERYSLKYPIESKMQLKKVLMGNNKQLANTIREFIRDYEITL